MTLYDKIHSKVKEQLSKSLSQDQLRKSLTDLLIDQSPTDAFHQLKLQSIKQPILLFTQLMVQDMRQSYYSYPFVIEKPLSQKSKVFSFKYGHKQSQFDSTLLQNPNFYYYLQDQQVISCMPVIGQTEWVRGIEKNNLDHNKIYQMITQKIGLFKLGQVFSAICFYQPQEKILYFIRKATQEQITKWTNYSQYISKQINIQQTRNKLLKLFQTVQDQRYSKYLLYTLLSNQHFFISGTQNHSNIFKKLLPRVCELKVQAPFKQSFFPYKNQEQVLVKTQMQMSQNHTVVVLDFSNFSSQKQVKIGPEQIDNLKALKVFVEQGNTIYRWLYGQSQIKHCHTGVIVKASSIINPQFVIPPKNETQMKLQTPQIDQSDLRSFRCYIEQVRKINPILKEDRKEIEEKINSEKIKFNELSLTKVMELAKLNAKSLGRDQIKTQDYDLACSLFF